ncbi:Ureidoglycolate lyase [Tolypocladium ophioglossoides CBS 100239]|uniref:Ureidoglycolate lyase n=1 Tax=Tolypocladium ophioglossoides (strain CBS 100239) TaxID=1163406 RepID=A0A0L0N6N4_TOLOC|nr:Ureidoglycolate lyase [Tolypocladium ophioglossoides CBS 100239]
MPASPSTLAALPFPLHPETPADSGGLAGQERHGRTRRAGQPSRQTGPPSSTSSTATAATAATAAASTSQLRAAMALSVNIGDRRVCVTAQALAPGPFAPFGAVIANPRPDVHPSAFAAAAASLPADAVSANQGSAIQYRAASRARSLYAQAPSGRADPVTSVFVCAARALRPAAAASAADAPHRRFTVRVVERHPFTTQTFAPLASSASAYLVVVAPSLAPAAADAHLPVPRGPGLPGSGLPDLRGLRAFVASGAQAVTYGAGTWHAPMVVPGEPGATLDFVVSQWMSGVRDEDCQLVEFESQGAAEPRVEVRIPQPPRLEKL